MEMVSSMIDPAKSSLGGRYQDPVEIRQHIKLKRVLYWHKLAPGAPDVVSGFQVRAQRVKCYYENELFFIQDTANFANEYKQFRYALTINKYSCVSIAGDNDFKALQTFMDVLFEHGVDFDKYDTSMHAVLIKARQEILGHQGTAGYNECLKTLEWSRETYDAYCKQLSRARQSKKRGPTDTEADHFARGYITVYDFFD